MIQGNPNIEKEIEEEYPIYWRFICGDDT